MLICSCNALRESQVREVARTSPDRRVCGVYARLGCKMQCAGCAVTVHRLIQEECRPALV